CGKRGLRRRLEDDGAAGRDGWARFSRDHCEREVPWRDAGDDANGFLRDDDALVGLVTGNGVAVDSRGLLAEPCVKRRRVRGIALPCSSVISLARSSWFAIIRSNQRRRTAARSLAVLRRHAGNARAAASMARRVSSRPSFGTTPSVSPVAGLSTSIDPRAPGS